MEGILEGLLFISGDEGLTLDRIKTILEIDDVKLGQIINNLNNSYDSNERGIRLEQNGSTLKLVTKIEYKDYDKKLEDIDNDMLTPSALETLAIVAYNQPIIRSEVDSIRGVDSSYNMRKLVIKGLIEEKGRSELPGRPIIYGTTDRFLDHFGIHSLNELPKIEAESIDEEEVNLFESKYQEN